MDEYKLDYTAEEVNKRLGMVLPMVTINDLDDITDEENTALNAAWETGLPCILAWDNRVAVIPRDSNWDGSNAYLIDEGYLFLFRDTPDSRWYVEYSGE